MTYTYSRSETLGLALQNCTYCWGMGLVPGKRGVDRPCGCVFRAVFRACFKRFEECQRFDTGRMISGKRCGGVAFSYSYKDQEYSADFVLLSQRVLGRDTLAGRLFRFHYLLGADWKLCTRQLGIDRGAFFHEVYRVQERLGQAFVETKPYGLFPLDEYFGGTFRRHAAVSGSAGGIADNGEPLRAPLLKVAA